jgi:hypothetical protein
MQVSATGRSNPVLSPEPAARSCIAFDQPPSLHPFRADPQHQFVHRLRWYYAAVRLPASVHHRRTSLDFSMRSQHAGWEERRISRFSRKLLPCMPGVSDRAGYHRASPNRHTGCCLPPASTESASRVRLLSRLNTLPALSPVNASPSPLRAPPHDSGSLWLASPLTYDSFIHYNLPVYPGALRQSRLDATGLFRGDKYDECQVVVS